MDRHLAVARFGIMTLSPLLRSNGNGNGGGSGSADPAVEGNGTVNGEVVSRWRNDSEGGWIVQKFGGTSVGKFAVNIAEDIVRFVFCPVLMSGEEGRGGGMRGSTKAIMRRGWGETCNGKLY